jgi:hypothetical protein
MYRLYFRKGGSIVGRDDFEAEDDGEAVYIARSLFNACSDMCNAFELWRGIHQVVVREPALNHDTEQFRTHTQEIVISRELTIRASAWRVANSKRLLSETQPIVDRALRQR